LLPLTPQPPTPPSSSPLSPYTTLFRSRAARRAARRARLLDPVVRARVDHDARDPGRLRRGRGGRRAPRHGGRVVARDRARARALPRVREHVAEGRRRPAVLALARLPPRPEPAAR